MLVANQAAGGFSNFGIIVSSKRVTLKQIGEAAGVHPTTVSMALRNHPRIPKSTRDRLKKLADKMGYIPDPMLASLNAYRHTNVEKKFLSKLAWLNICMDPEWPLKTRFVREYFEGAKMRAQQLGYGLEVFNAHPLKIPTRRLQQILLSRSIQGVVIAPLQANYPEAVTTIDLDWSQFCSVTYGYSLESPEINRVTTDHYHAVMETLTQLHKLGFQRPGLFLSRKNNARISRLWEAGYMVGMRAIFKSKTLPIALFEQGEDRTSVLEEWYHSVQPDVIIAQDYASVRKALEEKRIPVPGKTKLVLLEESDRGFPSIDQKQKEIGAMAVNLLVGTLQRQEHGLPDTPSVTLLKGQWKSGTA
jgi:DNA-binding LacI/PurR family transcriptional regulator